MLYLFKYWMDAYYNVFITNILEEVETVKWLWESIMVCSMLTPML